MLRDVLRGPPSLVCVVGGGERTDVLKFDPRCSDG
jgi:hypothetical protein